MTVNSIILLTIVSSLAACGLAGSAVQHVEVTVNQLMGQWYEMGKISATGDRVAQSCVTHTLENYIEGEYQFYHSVIQHENIPTCVRGVPIRTESNFGLLEDSVIYLNPYNGGWGFYRIKSYNNGRELIFTELEENTWIVKSYALWSRGRKVSAETKAAFGELTKNLTVVYTDIYNSWDNCPKVRGEIDDYSSVEKHRGLWYNVAAITNGPPNLNPCIPDNITVDNEGNIAMMNVPESVDIIVSESGTHISFLKEEGEREESEVIFCNNGQEIIVLDTDTETYLLGSHDATVNAETMAGFRRIADIVKRPTSDSTFTTFSQDGCPERND